jgi:hypothetical protein
MTFAVPDLRKSAGIDARIGKNAHFRKNETKFPLFLLHLSKSAPLFPQQTKLHCLPQ